MKNIFSAIAAVAAVSASAAFADSEITLTDARAFTAPKTAMAAGAFVTITNAGSTDDRLVAVQADFPRAEIHTTVFEDDIAKMMHIDGIDIPAGETVMLKPGELHIMFMGLNGDPLEEGETVEAILVFEQAGELPVTFAVVPRPAMHMANH